MKRKRVNVLYRPGRQHKSSYDVYRTGKPCNTGWICTPEVSIPASTAELPCSLQVIAAQFIAAARGRWRARQLLCCRLPGGRLDNSSAVQVIVLQ